MLSKPGVWPQTALSPRVLPYPILLLSLSNPQQQQQQVLQILLPQRGPQQRVWLGLLQQQRTLLVLVTLLPRVQHPLAGQT